MNELFSYVGFVFFSLAGLFCLVVVLVFLRIAHKLDGPPDFVIGGQDNPYMLRWWVIPRNYWFNIYLHKILRDDADCALHDHPWWNVSILLEGSYGEVVPDPRFLTPGANVGTLPTICKTRRAGSIVVRRATAAHRLVVRRGPVWSLFITGPVRRRWGFHCPRGWRHWRDAVSKDDPGSPATCD